MLTIALSSGEKYVAGAYVVFLLLILAYLAIMATKLARIEREVVQIVEDLDRREAAASETAPSTRSKEPVG